MIQWDDDISIFIHDDVSNNLTLFDDFCSKKNNYFFQTYLRGDGGFGLSRLYIKHLKVSRQHFIEAPYVDAHIDIFHYRNYSLEGFKPHIIRKIKRLNYFVSIKDDKGFLIII